MNRGITVLAPFDAQRVLDMRQSSRELLESSSFIIHVFYEMISV
jgi:hypothetical protein